MMMMMMTIIHTRDLCNLICHWNGLYNSQIFVLLLAMSSFATNRCIMINMLHNFVQLAITTTTTNLIPVQANQLCPLA